MELAAFLLLLLWPFVSVVLTFNAIVGFGGFVWRKIGTFYGMHLLAEFYELLEESLDVFFCVARLVAAILHVCHICLMKVCCFGLFFGGNLCFFISHSLD